MSPEQVPEPGTPEVLKVAGLDLQAAIPPGKIPLAGLVVLHLFDPDTKDYEPNQLWMSTTKELPSWEVAGMCDFVKTIQRQEWIAGATGHPVEDGEEE